MRWSPFMRSRPAGSPEARRVARIFDIVGLAIFFVALTLWLTGTAPYDLMLALATVGTAVTNGVAWLVMGRYTSIKTGTPESPR